MTSSRKLFTLMLFFSLFILAGCAEYAPKEPALNTGTVFHYPVDVVRSAARKTLANLKFAITLENDDYIEAVHLKEGETVEDSKSELVGIWFKKGSDSVTVLVDTEKRASGRARQRVWDEDIIRELMRELP
jgi:hypothetical protein